MRIPNKVRLQQIEQLVLEGVPLDEVGMQQGISTKQALRYYNQIRTAKRPLSKRERQVAEFITNGMNSQAIGDTLGLSPRTVDNHRAVIMRKLSVATHVQLATKLRDLEIERLMARLAELEAVNISQAEEIERLKGRV